MKDLLFVFPGEDQCEAIEAWCSEEQRAALVVRPPEAKERPGAQHAGVRYVPARYLLTNPGFATSARWICCSELGVYFAARHREYIGTLNFDWRCLDMVLKVPMAWELRKAGVRATPKTRLADVEDLASLAFPLIVKPNFGFASAQVKRVTSFEEMCQYLDGFAALRGQTMVPQYAATYFPDTPPQELDMILIEPDFTDFTFLSTPFIVRNGCLSEAFPVVGIKPEVAPETDFRWHGFLVDKDLFDPVPRDVCRQIERIVAGFGLEDGVYELELLYDASSDLAYVLEFSPRVSGGSIPQLIKFATGVDLLAGVVALAAGTSFCSRRHGHRNLAVFRIPEEKGLDQLGPEHRVLATYSRRMAGHPYLDVVVEPKKPNAWQR